jgi:hypothetical protein
MTDLEALSHLLDGDLPDGEAEELRRRIDSDPELAASWAAMQALPGELAGLEERPPARLDARILRPSHQPPRRNWTPWVAAAAALILLGIWSKPTPTRVLIGGQELVSGTTLVLAGDTEVRVQGRALISVEPPPGFVREEKRTQEIAQMNRTHLAAALAGAFVTVAVYEGTAAVTPAGAQTVAVAAGETRSFGAPRTPKPLEVRRSLPGAVTSTELGELEALREENRILEAQVAASRIGAQFADARIEGHEGVPQPWPEDIPAAWQPEPFEAAMAAAMEAAGIGGFPLEVDCSEFPCLAMIEASALDDRPDDLWDRVVAGMSDPLGGNLRTGIHASNIGSQDGPSRSFGVLSFWPADRPAEGAKERMGYRADSMVEDAMGEDPTPDPALVR